MNAKTVVALLFVHGLAGCAWHEENVRRHEAERMARFETQCIGYGFTRGMPDFRQCVMQMDLADRNLRQGQGIFLMQQGLDMNRRMYCARDWLGNFSCR